MAVSPALASAQALLGNSKSGPYIHHVVFDVITQEDQRVMAIQDGDIGLIDDQLDPSFLETLVEAENIVVFHKVRQGYGYVQPRDALVKYTGSVGEYTNPIFSYNLFAPILSSKK